MLSIYNTNILKIEKSLRISWNNIGKARHTPIYFENLNRDTKEVKKFVGNSSCTLRQLKLKPAKRLRIMQKI